MTKRKLADIVGSFYEYTASLPSPTLFRKWSGIAMLAAVMEQKVWINTGHGKPLYPNMYTILVAPPGVGKTVLTSQVWNFWHELADGGKGMHVASSSVTSASIMDDLRDSERSIFPAKLEKVTFNSLAICAGELGVFLPSYESDMMSKLTDIYDSHPYSERRRTKDLMFSIPKPQLNILGATTPGYMTVTLPDAAWDQGFLSRTVLVYSSEHILKPLFAESAFSEELRKDILHDLKVVYEMYGKMEFTPEAVAMINTWYMAGGPPAPDHPRLQNYKTRRITHLLKLSMIAAISLRAADEGEQFLIQKHHVEQALDWLIEVEYLMPDIFKAMVVNADSKAIDECWHFTFHLWMKEAKPIAEHRIINFLQERVPVHNVARILEIMVRAAILKESLEPAIGKAFTPKARR